jgi:DNA-binding transcriptional ArsR family regulator
VAPVEWIARRCGALSEQIRITLLDALRASANTIDELQQATGASKQEILRHPKVLLDAGLVSAVPVGNFLR